MAGSSVIHGRGGARQGGSHDPEIPEPTPGNGARLLHATAERLAPIGGGWSASNGQTRCWRERIAGVVRRLPQGSGVLRLLGNGGHPGVAFDWPDIIHCHNLHGEYFDLRELGRLSHRVPLIPDPA